MALALSFDVECLQSLVIGNFPTCANVFTKMPGAVPDPD